VNKHTDNPWKMAALISMMGLEVVLLTVAGAWIGRFLDAKWQMHPVFLASGVLLGLVAGFGSAIYTLRSFVK
jgi:ATP synthase protein I